VRFQFRLGESVGIGDLPRIGEVAAVRAALTRADADGLEGELSDGLQTGARVPLRDLSGTSPGGSRAAPSGPAVSTVRQDDRHSGTTPACFASSAWWSQSGSPTP
jgi:hypothetical protein